MRKRAFLIFIAVTGFLVAGAVGFMQSPQFATLLKRALAQYMPSDLGIEGDFSEFALRMFPPSVSIRKPRVVFMERNVASLPAGSTVSAERIDLVFLPFQMFSGNIRVHRVVIVKGDVQVAFDRDFFNKKPVRKKSAIPIHWDELLQIHAEGIALEETKVRARFESPALTASFTAQELSLEQWSGKGGMGYELTAHFRDIDGKFPKEWALPVPLAYVKAKARVNPLGLSVSDLAIGRQGLELRSSLTVKGNVLQPKTLPAEAEVSVRGDLTDLLHTIPGVSPRRSLPKGTVAFVGKVRSTLDRLMDTTRAEGTIIVDRPVYADWSADRISADVAWELGPGGGEVTVQKALVEGKPRPRENGRPGYGGRIEAGPLKLKLASLDRITVPLRLDRTHLHWLAGPGTDDIFALDFRASGTAEATYSYDREHEAWSVKTGVKLKLENFALDNQRLGKIKPMSQVLKVPSVGVEGAVTVDPEGVHPDLAVLLPRSRFHLGGKVDFNTGYDLRATGNVNLADIGALAENEVRGEGTVGVHVHGLSARAFVDFDADLVNAYYLRLKLGKLKGRITWDDDPAHLIFTNCEVVQGKTDYRVNGRFDLSDAETVDLTAQIPRGTVRDLFTTFDEMIGDRWWFPRSLDGETNGIIRVTGGIDLKKLVVSGDLRGAGWEYFGERFRNVSIAGGYDRGKYQISSFRAVKNQGILSGKISFDTSERLDWELKSEQLSLGDVDRIAHLDVPFRGRLDILSSGSGKEGAIESISRLAISDFAVRGTPMPASEAVLKTSKGTASFFGSAFGGEGLIDLFYDFKPGASSYVRAQARGLDYSPILLMLNPRMMQDRALTGLISGGLELSFRSGEVDRGNGRLDLSEYVLAKTGTSFRLAQPISVKMEHGTFDLPEVRLVGENGSARLSLRSRAAALDGRVEGDLDVSVAEFLTSTVEQARGIAGLDFTIGGLIKEPTIDGALSFKNAFAKIQSFESPFENIKGELALSQNIITVQGLESDLASGGVHGSGTIELFADRYPRINLAANLLDNRLKIYPFQFIKVRGRVAVKGDRIPYLVDGNIVAESALTKEKTSGAGQSRMLKTARYTPPARRLDEGNYPKFKLNIGVQADQGILVQNDLFDAEMKAKVTVVNTIETPRLLGNADLVQGKLVFKDRVFQINSANVEFDNPEVINPKFNLTAQTEVGGTKVQLYASGRLEDFKIELASNPVMPESEILSLLALGLTSDEVKRFRTADRTIFQQGEAASLVLHSLDFNRDVQDKTGFEIQIDEAVDTQSRGSLFQPRSEGDASVEPKIVIKKKINQRLDVSVGSTVGMGVNQQRELNAEIKLLPGVSIIGVGNMQEDVGTQSGRRAFGFGLDLKYQKRFK